MKIYINIMKIIKITRFKQRCLKFIEFKIWFVLKRKKKLHILQMSLGQNLPGETVFSRTWINCDIFGKIYLLSIQSLN